MNKKTIPIIAILAFTLAVLAGCDLIPPQCALELAGVPTYTLIGTFPNEDVEITFRLKNVGSVTLSDCKVQWYVDDAGATGVGTVEYDEITGWAPALGTTIYPGDTSGEINVRTTSGIFSDGVEFFGVYAWGWENPADEE